MIAADLLLLAVFLACAYALAGRLAEHPSLASRIVLSSLLVFALVIVFGSLLLLLDAFSVRLVLAGGAVVSLAGATLVRVPACGAPTGARRGGAAVVLGLLLVATLVAAPGYEITAMGSDAGVYVNRAIQLSTGGDLFPEVGVDVDALPTSLRETYLEDNARTDGTGAAVLVDGAKLAPRAGGRAIEFHALPAWPVVLSVAAHFAGIADMQVVSVLILATWALSLYVILVRLTARADIGAGVALASALLPISVYFAKYPTVELLLAMLFGGVVYLVAIRPRHVGFLVGALVGVYALVHMTGFVLVLVGLLAVPLVLASGDAHTRRELSAFLAVAGTSHLLAMLLARRVAGGYVSDLLGFGFGTADRGWLVLVALDLLAIVAAAASHSWRKAAVDAH